MAQSNRLLELVSKVEAKQSQIDKALKIVSKNQEAVFNEILILESFLGDFMNAVKASANEKQQHDIDKKVQSMVSKNVVLISILMLVHI